MMKFVIPAKAGIQIEIHIPSMRRKSASEYFAVMPNISLFDEKFLIWIPAFAGMTAESEAR